MHRHQPPRQISRFRRTARLAPALLLSAMLGGCLATVSTAVNDMSHSLSDSMAPKINVLVPSKNADAGTLRSLLILSDGTEVSNQVAMDLEAAMNKLRIEERPFYKRVQLGGRINGQVSDAQLAELAAKAGTEGVVIVSGGVSEIRNANSTEERSTCAVQTKFLKACPKEQVRSTRVSCTETRGLAAARIKVFRASDKRSVFTDNVGGESAQRVCSDELNVVRADPRQLSGNAVQNTGANVMRVLAPSYELRPLDLMSADAGLPAAQRKDFDAAVKFAEAKRMDEACRRFEELYLDHKESPALTFNNAFCAEVRGDLLRASQGYRRASELINAPNSQIDRRIAITEKAIRENPVAFMPADLAGTQLSKPPTIKGDGRRVALVIGNARYQRSALVNPVNDARLVGDKLTRIGFDVLTLENVDSARFATATRDFAKRAKGADIALFYYAGHAIQADGENFLMPVDNAKMRSIDDVRDQGSVQLADIVAQLEVAAPAVKLLVIDACRDNPLPATSRSLAGGGLADIKQVPQGGLIAFATSPGSTAEDGTARNSVFSKHFAAQLSVPNQSIEQTFKKVREAVKAETKNKQVPMEKSDLTGDVFLVRAK
ncbi:caspase family protein [Roseateles albus]|uniref:Caspase family protein n=1 Tax=Roseateles albus TaxID=2987525 RepID=A0ABT5K9Y3_9BURK|nr:caspase family protein [Roseateles albus]MDC8770234.1 caspase family protein [Roseateles albus]